jgi:hypothetical protein
MSLSAARPRSVRCSTAAPVRIACLVLVGLAFLCCVLGIASSGSGHHSVSSTPQAQAVTGGEVDAIAFTEGAGAHDHTAASCDGEAQLILGSTSSLQPLAAAAPAPSSATATEVGRGPVLQSSGCAGPRTGCAWFDQRR